MKLFIVVREDLKPGAQGAQSIHASNQFSVEHPEVFREWYQKSSNLVWLSVPDEPALEALAHRAAEQGVPVSRFREPDFKDALTAITIGPDGWKLTSSLPLALKEAA